MKPGVIMESFKIPVLVNCQRVTPTPHTLDQSLPDKLLTWGVISLGFTEPIGERTEAIEGMMRGIIHIDDAPVLNEPGRLMRYASELIAKYGRNVYVYEETEFGRSFGIQVS